MSDFGLDGLDDVDEQETSSSSSSSSSSSEDSEYPRYIEETPFLAVVREGDSLVVRNRPRDVAITYRQYNESSDLKKHSVPDCLVEYWITDWEFKSASHRYEKKTGRSLLDDLREYPLKTLEELKDTTPGSGVSNQVKKCSVCGEELDSNDGYIVIQSKMVHSEHTTEELVDAGVLNMHTRKEIKDNQKETIRDTPDTANRRWE